MNSKGTLIGIVLAILVLGSLAWVIVGANKQESTSISTISTAPVSATATQSTAVAPDATTTAVAATTTIIASTAKAVVAMAIPSTDTSAGRTFANLPATETQPAMNFEVVTSAAAQEQGLSNRATIPDDYAMLFAFPTDNTYGFWMKDMLTSLDMVWLSDNGTIVQITDSISPDTYPKVVYPPQPVKYVLETKAGFAREHGWKVGTRVQLPLPYGE